MTLLLTCHECAQAQDLRGLPPDSERQQEAVLAVAQNDAFNWGCA